jgi:hypothetical protein
MLRRKRKKRNKQERPGEWLLKLSDKELLEKYYEASSKNILKNEDKAKLQPNSTFYLQELYHRRADRHTKTMLWLTIVITILTFVNVLIVAKSYLF